MRYFVVDDEAIILRDTARILDKVVREELQDDEPQIYTYSSAIQALEEAKEKKPFLILLDIDMPGINGIEMAKELEKLSSGSNLIFVTGYPKYSLDAWDTSASSFLLKPLKKADLAASMHKLRNPVETVPGQQQQMALRKEANSIHEEKPEITCFGGFKVTYGGEPVRFKRKKSLEMLAILVHNNGAEVSNEYIRSLLWELEEDNESKKAYVRTLAADISQTFESLGCNEVIRNTFGGYALNLQAVTCDYADYMRGVYQGSTDNYMPLYEWARE